MRHVPYLRFFLATLSVLGTLPQHAQAVHGANEVEQLLSKGEQALQSGQLSTAESLFQRVTALAPAAADGYFGLGLVRLREGKLEQATNNLSMAIQRNATLEGAHLFRGIAEYQAGEPTKATADFQSERALNANNVQAALWLGIVALGQDDPGDAVEPLDRAAALQPRDPEILYYQARAHALVAEGALHRLYEIDPDSAFVHRAAAESLAGSDQPEKAVAEYQLALKKEPDNPDLYEALGEQNQKLSRFDEARVAYEQELKLNPGSGVALYNLGKMDVETGKAESGVPLLRRAQAAHLSGAPTDFYLGLGLARVGDSAEAVHWLEQALANHPSPFIEQSTLFQLGRLYQKLGRREDAQRTLERLKQLKANVSSEDPADGVSPAAASSEARPNSNPVAGPHR